MIEDCEGCKEDYDFMMLCLKETENLRDMKLHFAGTGLDEDDKHLDLILVSEKGELVVF